MSSTVSSVECSGGPRVTSIFVSFQERASRGLVRVQTTISNAIGGRNSFLALRRAIAVAACLIAAAAAFSYFSRLRNSARKLDDGRGRHVDLSNETALSKSAAALSASATRHAGASRAVSASPSSRSAPLPSVSGVSENGNASVNESSTSSASIMDKLNQLLDDVHRNHGEIKKGVSAIRQDREVSLRAMSEIRGD